MTDGGIDFALRITAEVAGERVAERIQLMLEYDPASPFNAGSPRVADRALTEELRQALAPRMEVRAAAVRRAAERLGL